MLPVDVNKGCPGDKSPLGRYTLHADLVRPVTKANWGQTPIKWLRNQIHWHHAAAQWACAYQHSAIGRVQDAVANDSDHSGLVF